MLLLRRWLLLMALMFWQGGFMFYGAVVVDVGSNVLGSHLEQGFITQSVTNYLNLAGLIAIAIWTWDLISVPCHSRIRWMGLAALALTLAILTYLHMKMDSFLDADARCVLDPAQFYLLHRAYLITSTAQWIGFMGLLANSIHAWREEDANQVK